MERQSHNNPWADKLQEVSIPEAGEAWQAMESPTIGVNERISFFMRVSLVAF